MQTSSANMSKEIMTEKTLKKSNKIEKELFQTAADKKNVQNERSLLFINQRFKTALRNQMYNSQIHNLNKPFTISERLPQIKVIPSSSVQVNVSPPKELFTPIIKIKGNSFSRYGSLNLDGELKNRLAIQEGVQMKSAILRPLNKNTEDNIDRKTSVSYPEDKMKHYQNIKPQHYQNLKPLESSFARPRINYNNDFPTPLKTHGSVFGNSDISSLSEDLQIEGSLETDDISNLSPLDLDHDGKLLERYIKETLEEFDINANVANDPIKCQKCISKAQSNAILNCNCHKVKYPRYRNTYGEATGSHGSELSDNVSGDKKTVTDALLNNPSSGAAILRNLTHLAWPLWVASAISARVT